MKRVLLLLIVLFCAGKSKAQTMIQDFSNGKQDWLLAPNFSIDAYSKPTECTTNDIGLITPGVGKTAPVRIISPILTYDGNNPNFLFSFFVYVFNSTLNCSSYKPFPCSTYVKIYLVDKNYTDIKSNSVPAANQIYAQNPDYQLVNANSSNTVLFENVVFPTSNTEFRILLEFKTAQSDNCTGEGTKFVFDDFSLEKPVCNTCPPVANSDYFPANLHPINTIKGNVFGGFAKWLNELLPTYSDYTLTSSHLDPATDEGVDYDPNNLSLLNMKFELIPSSLKVFSSCSGTGEIVFQFYENGRFFIDRTNNTCVHTVTFEYRLINRLNSLVSSVAKVTVEFPDNSPMPVTFSNFHAQRNRDKVALKWETVSEQNNRGFNVQRNTRGVWETVAFVFSGADGGNSDELLSYEYKDANSEKGVSQYRIQQVDFDGRASYSAIRSVKGLEQAATRTVVYPNPSSDGKVSVVFEDQGAKAVTVSDLSGRIIRQYRSVLNNVQIEGLESGMYSIQVTDLSSAVSSTEKVIIKKR